MSKKLTSLEAFDKVLDIICKQKADNNLQSYIDIVEMVLEALEIIKEHCSFEFSIEKGMKTDYMMVIHSDEFLEFNMVIFLKRKEFYVLKKVLEK